MKQTEGNYKNAQALVYSLDNLTLLLLGPRYWMPSVYLIQYSVSSTETSGKTFLPLRRKRNGASVRERSWPRWCKALLHVATPHLPFFHVCVTACPSFYISSNTSSFQRHSSLGHSSLRHSCGMSSTLISNFARRRTPDNKGRGQSISSLLTIAVLKFQLRSLFCATA